MDYTPEIVVVGSHAPGLFVRVKRIPLAGETVIGWDFREPVDGGKGSNQAIAAARLGTAVSFVGCLGDDRVGRIGETWMKEAGVDTRHVLWNPEVSTGEGIIMLDEKSQPAMVVTRGANAKLTSTHVEHALGNLCGAKVMLTQFEINPDIALHASAIARRNGMISIVNPAPAPDGMPLGRMEVDILVPNEMEARELAHEEAKGIKDPIALANFLRSRTGAECVMITLGEGGVAVSEDTGSWHIPAPNVQAIDTSGAGDVFCAALAMALARGVARREAVEWSCFAAALSVTRLGTIPAFPTAKEVVEFVQVIGGAIHPQFLVDSPRTTGNPT
jgi:ribokinase